MKDFLSEEGNGLRNGHLKEIIKVVRKDRRLPDNVEIKTAVIRKRKAGISSLTLKRGLSSPIFSLKYTFVMSLILMASTRLKSIIQDP